MKRAGVIAVLVAVAFVGVGVAPAPAEALSKPEARSKSNAKVRTFLARSSWANRANVGRCTRKAKRRVVCFGAVRGKGRTCRVRVVVAGQRKRAKLRRGKCRRLPQRQQPAAQHRAFLSAWLGAPGRVQSNPFHVTYPHGATTQTASFDGEPAETSPGVLALYVEGNLRCAANVNEANPEASCPVTYSQLGSYRVTTIFTSGSESAADSMVHVVEPLAVPISLEADFVELEGGSECQSTWGPSNAWRDFNCLLGTLTITASSDPPGLANIPGIGPLEGTADAVLRVTGQETFVPTFGCSVTYTLDGHSTPFHPNIGLTATVTALGYTGSAAAQPVGVPTFC